MTRGYAADTRPGSARRGLLACAAALLLMISPAARAQGASTPPIVIPPATVPPPGAAGGGAPVRPTIRALLPTRLQILRDSRGTGLVMYGTLTAGANSALAVLQGVFAYSQAFDPIPALRLVLADRDDRRAQALFSATAKGVPVTGIVVVSLGDDGGDVSVFYDRAGDFAASFERMRRALVEGDDSAAVLTPLGLGDGNRIGVPPGWRLIGQGANLVDLMGTQGEFVSLGEATPVYANPSPPAGNAQGPCCDPLKALQSVYPQLNANAQHLGSPAQLLTQIVESQPTPAPNGGQAAFVLSKLTVGGRPYSYFALVQAVDSFTDPWTLILSGVTAPQAVFADEFPAMLQIWRSYSGNPPGFAEGLRQALSAMPATRQLVRAASVVHRTARDNAAPGWGGAIAALAESRETPIADTVAATLADKLSADTGTPWRIVPLSELK